MLHLYNQLGRRVRKSSQISLTPVARFCLGLPRPNPKSLVIIRGLPLSITNTKFSEAISGVDIRKSEVEPGCALHIIDEAGAQIAAKIIRKDLGLKATVKNTALPSLVVKNLPNDVSADTLRESFGKFEPLAVRMSGKRSITITVPNADDSLTALKLAQTILIGGRSLTGHSSRTPDGRYSVQINNIPEDEDLSTAMRSVSEVVCAQLPEASLSWSKGHSTVTVRLSDEMMKTSSSTRLQDALKQISFGSAMPVSRSIKQLLKPALFLRNVSTVNEDLLRTLCVEENKAERVQMTWKSRDISGDFAVAYFKSEEDAREAVRWIKSSGQDPKKAIKPAYRELSEPAVKLANVPTSVTNQFKIQQMLPQFRISRVEILPGASKDRNEVIVVVSSDKDVKNLISVVNRQNPGGHNIVAEACPQFDTGLEFVFPENEVPNSESVINALKNASIDFKSVSTDTNISAYVAFPDQKSALQCQRAFRNREVEGSDSWTRAGRASGGVSSAELSHYPSYAVEVMGLSPEESAEPVLNAVTNAAQVFRAERMASVKFKKHAHVVPGMKQLRQIEIDGVQLRPERNHPVAHEGDSEYDTNGETEFFDREHLKSMMTDYLSAEPAIRYQIARNYFERALYTVQGMNDISELLHSNAPNSMLAEAKELFKERTNLTNLIKDDEEPTKEVARLLEVNTGKLFRLFIQREDMLKFTHDFEDWEATLGPASPDDIYAWNNFLLESEEDYDRLEADLRSYNYMQYDKGAAKEEKRVNAKRAKMYARKSARGEYVPEEYLGKAQSEEGVDTEGEVPKALTEGESEGKEEVKAEEDEDSDEAFMKNATEKDSYDKFDVDAVADHDGHLWSGIVVHSDTTQKITPGGRVMSHRALVCIGNMKGVGGYGMGKGETSSIALSNAFRDALNNLLFMDLYENAALAHDVFGRENNCYVYIRATPKTRLMVASPLAQAIFNQMGIVSVSCKIVGRRHPYAQVRAIFKALAKHKNIDEIAKERGSRYLTLKWMYDNAI